MSSLPVEAATILRNSTRHGPSMATTLSLTRAKNEEGLTAELLSIETNPLNPPPELQITEEEESQKLKDARIEAKRIVRYDDVFDQRTLARKLIKTAKCKAKKTKGPILIVRRVFDIRGRYESTKADPSLFYHTVTHLRARLAEEEVKPSPDLVLKADLNTTLRFIDEQHGNTFKEMESLTSHGEITWDLLWALFRPNDLIYYYHEHTEQPQAFLYRGMEIRYTQTSTRFWAIKADFIADSGQKFGYASPRQFEIHHFEGARKIRDLTVYPLGFRPDQAELRLELIARGKKYALLSKPTIWETSGPAMTEERNRNWETRQFKFTSQGRAMIDAAAFRSFNSNISYIPTVHTTVDREHLTEDQLLMCPPVALGFSFGNKQWGGFAVSRLVEVEWQPKVFDSLELDHHHKALIHSLVKEHSSSDFEDVIKGKGKGLIGLLSGSPGCGKTLTAEAIAEACRKPLYLVSAGELGTKADEVDQRLKLILELSHKWDAVLLLDEADVFLQKRDNEDVKRNALVSIFLRQLEYFQGVLFLTTNRIQDCDPAFESRIHISILYPQLNFAARRKIWSLFIYQADKDSDRSDPFNPEDLDRLASYSFNGRQIKHLVANARSIARGQGRKICIQDVDIVVDVHTTWNASKNEEEPISLI